MKPRRTADARRDRSGQTLLELMAAATIIALTLVPALRMMRDTMRIGRETETANLLATFSASKLEEHMLLTAVNWNSSTVQGNFTSEGYPQARFQVVRSDSAAAGGIPGSLMSITSTVWQDANGNGQWDQGEPRAVFASKLASNLAYQQQASGS